MRGTAFDTNLPQGIEQCLELEEAEVLGAVWLLPDSILRLKKDFEG